MHWKPDFSELPTNANYWEHTVYGSEQEIIPKYAPPPKGKFVTLTNYVNANLMHCILTGRYITDIIQLLNGTPIDSFSKKQSTIETATYNSEYTAACTYVEQIIDLRLSIRYLGVPIRKISHGFGDNESCVNSSSVPHGKLHKRHLILSCLCVREVITSKIFLFYHNSGASNPADIVSKH